ncbi:glycoside hydrolase family 99-like domain-containing protein [uncultured Thomasclavelia sp.]|uniref:glycosyltransferase WbsX family protein n=1 Tax=uncultured Thomasclavelia sp. TaxID=3025759 RepID=UPI002633F453|nr:glycoside hydrolase family 99-like domain-containing protein [uncultured Thomasclavelia sp.]
MAEIYKDDKLKIIAFYLPQFHSIKENDKWWGKGFTEWTNVKKAVPLYPGHDQPRIPLNDNYYNLLDDDTKIWQANLAKKYGVYGFCYYHYWFKGKKLLEKPAEQMLKNKSIDLPFCFCWANENWSRNWDGGNREIIVKQDYGEKKDWEEHFQYLLTFFKDSRYITVNGKPLLVIYKPDLINSIYEMVSYFKKRIVEEGFPGICLAFQFPTYYMDVFYRDDIFDYMIEFEPVFSRNNIVRHSSKKIEIVRKFFGEKMITKYRNSKNQLKHTFAKPHHLSMFFYDEAWEKILNQKWNNKLLPGTFVDWDNTPRNKHGVVYSGFTIEKFEDNIKKLVKRAYQENKPMLFINAWNEWGEGAYLEPDERYGYRKLEAIRSALDGDDHNGCENE